MRMKRVKEYSQNNDIEFSNKEYQLMKKDMEILMRELEIQRK